MENGNKNFVKNKNKKIFQLILKCFRWLVCQQISMNSFSSDVYAFFIPKSLSPLTPNTSREVFRPEVADSAARRKKVSHPFSRRF